MCEEIPIYTRRITRIFQKLPAPPSNIDVNLNVLNFWESNVYHHPLVGDIHLDEISPYCLKDEHNVIFENLYQGSKVYAHIEPQHEVKNINGSPTVIWSSGPQDHVVDGHVRPSYWEWRQKLMKNPYAVRYPAGMHDRHKCLYALHWNHNQQSWDTLDYISSRKKIYCQNYERLVKTTTAYKQLKELYDSGVALQICEMDVRDSMWCTRDSIRHELYNTHAPFGHGLCLATCLMGYEELFYE